ncbi:MAG: hypothetical protein M1812_006097 [Candelaria pacifica]|nr:MAG: hypothetical protein M1812_006097 [Candelaria pacifica]
MDRSPANRKGRNLFPPRGSPLRQQAAPPAEDTMAATTMAPKEDKEFDGVIVINYTPDSDSSDEWDDGFGPSLRKVINVTQALLKGDKDDAGLKLARIVKVIVMGRWDSKYATANAAEAKESVETKAVDKNGQEIASHLSSHDIHGKKGDEHDKDCKGEAKPPTKDELYENATAVARIAEVVYLMVNLETFEWRGELPFVKEMWRAIRPSKLETMYLDIWRPGVTRDGTPGDVLLLEDMRPLREYVHVKDLTIIGMLDSYQPMIWEAVWAMKVIRLDLRMALEPVLRRGNEWPFIQNRWKMRKLEEVGRGYHGDKGSGIIHNQLGYGEYLDPLAIMKARNVMRPVIDKEEDKVIHLKHLALAGFVIDAQPFMKAFCQGCLKHLEILHDCIDAGMSMPEKMLQNLEVSIPTTETGTRVRITKYTPSGRDNYEPARHVPDDQVDPTKMYMVTLVGGVVVHRELAYGNPQASQAVEEARFSLQSGQASNQGRQGGQSRRGRRGGRFSGGR